MTERDTRPLQLQDRRGFIHINLALSEQQKLAIERAAERDGLHPTEFMFQAIMERADTLPDFHDTNIIPFRFRAAQGPVEEEHVNDPYLSETDQPKENVEHIEDYLNYDTQPPLDSA